jgi:ankyrin repeat protein
MCSHLHVVQMLADRGADLSMVDNEGWNLLHYAAIGCDCQCIEWVFANTMIVVNSITTDQGETPIMHSLQRNNLKTSKLLIERGAYLFMKSNDGVRAIDIPIHNDDDVVLGPQVLQHALDLRWSSVKHLLFISNFYETSYVIPFSSSSSSSSSSSAVVPQLRRSSRIAAPSHSAHLASSVLIITGLVRHIAEYLIRTELIV